MKKQIPFGLRKKFCDDFKLPIKMYDDEHFDYLCELYDKHLKISEKKELFLDTVSQFDSHEDFSKSWYKIKDAIFEKVSVTPEFQKLINTDLNYQFVNEFARNNPYNEATANRVCVSIDIRKANYTSLQHFDPKIVLDTKTFEEFITLFSPLKYYQEVKIFRQLLFEPLNAKRQNTIQKKLTDDFVTHFKECVAKDSSSPNIEIRTPSSDETLLIFDKGGTTIEQAEIFVQNIVREYDLGSLFKVEGFKIKPLKKGYFYKLMGDGSVVLRNVPYYYYPQCFKKIQGLSLNPLDMDFYFEDELATFKLPLFSEET